VPPNTTDFHCLSLKFALISIFFVEFPPGQINFRSKLLKIYNEKCAISATNLPPVLEAAHIVPYQGVETNNITNGILLRSDFHILFD
jgi:predicted restriction endonuclease